MLGSEFFTGKYLTIKASFRKKTPQFKNAALIPAILTYCKLEICIFEYCNLNIACWKFIFLDNIV